MTLRYPSLSPFIANTDRAWFDYLSSRASHGRVDEVNFWLPKASRPMKEMSPGEPLFFRLKKPHYAIAGYGFFAHFEPLDLSVAWSVFSWKNGDPDKESFLTRIGRYRGVDLLQPGASAGKLGCTILRDAIFWPESRWIPWGESEGWAPNIVQGKSERDEHRMALLRDAIMADSRGVPEDLLDQFTPLEVDERRLILREETVREGQGAFRRRLNHAYEGQCAITGEHTGTVLDAAHIQPYFGSRSNHVQNGLLLTKEFHALFDEGYVAITPEYEIRVSSSLRADWSNGKRYYEYDKKRLRYLPRALEQQPSRQALDWHIKHVFKKSG